jgi:methyltransferase
MVTLRTRRRFLTALVAAVACQRLAELVVSRRHERALLADGAVEHGRSLYPAMVALHTGWLGATLAEGWWRGARMRSAPLLAFAAVQPLRWWTIRSLGSAWTTRVLVIPGRPLVHTGPYRWLRHPNYAVVRVEIAALPAGVGAPVTAVIASLLNGVVLRRRIAVEDAALGAADCRTARPEDRGRDVSADARPGYS